MPDVPLHHPLSIPGMLLTALRDLVQAADAELGPLDADDIAAYGMDGRTPLDDARLLAAVALRIADADADHAALGLTQTAAMTRDRLAHTVYQMEALLRQARAWLEEVPC